MPDDPIRRAAEDLCEFTGCRLDGLRIEQTIRHAMVETLRAAVREWDKKATKAGDAGKDEKEDILLDQASGFEDLADRIRAEIEEEK